MARKKKTRKITDIMPMRKSDKKPEMPKSGKKLTRYELDAKSREDKKKRKHKGLASGSRHSGAEKKTNRTTNEIKDPRIGSHKKIPLIVEFVNKPQKSSVETSTLLQKLDPMVELERLENNEILNELLDRLEEGKTLSKAEQQFVDECLERVAELMKELGIEDDEENEEDLYRTFEKININRFK